MNRTLTTAMALGTALLITGITHAVIVEEDLASAPNDGPNGWEPITNTDTNPPASTRSDDDGGKLVINTFGQSNAGIAYTQLNALPHVDVQWLNAEMIADVSRSQAPAAPGTDGLGVCISLQNENFGYAMGLKTVDLDDGVQATAVVIFNQIGGNGPVPTPIPVAVHTIPDTGVNAHRYNAEWEGDVLKVYVDGYQGDPPALTVASNQFLSLPPLTPTLFFGDIRSTGEADGNIYHVRFSDGERLLPDPTNSVVAASTVMASNAVAFSFATETNDFYALQLATDLAAASNTWSAIGPTVIGTGDTMTLYHETGAPSIGIYRVLQLVPETIGP